MQKHFKDENRYISENLTKIIKVCTNTNKWHIVARHNCVNVSIFVSDQERDIRFTIQLEAIFQNFENVPKNIPIFRHPQ